MLCEIQTPVVQFFVFVISGPETQHCAAGVEFEIKWATRLAHVL